MKNSFLAQLSNHILKKYGDRMGDALILMPGRRPFIFLKKYLGEKLKRASWLPELLTIEDLAVRISGLSPADNLSQLFLLYEAHREVSNEPDSFGDFLKWAPVALTDFNEIDSHLTPPEKLFTYLHEARVLEIWNPGESSLTEFQNRYLDFWKSLGALYTRFRELCIESGEGHNGLNLRLTAERDALPSWLANRPVIIAGFNALTPAEEKIIGLLIAQGAEEFFDADSYYLDRPEQEAGKFLRKLKSGKKSECFQFASDQLLSDKSISIKGVAGEVLQARMAGLLANKTIKETGSYPAIVLANESLLLPLLNALPKDQPINITMGFPLQLSPAYRLLREVLRARKHLSHGKIYFRTVQNLLGNSIIQDLDPNGSRAFARIQNYISKNNKIRVSIKEISTAAGPESDRWFSEIAFLFDPGIALPLVLLTVIEKVKASLDGGVNGSNDLLRDQLYKLNQIISRIQTLPSVPGEEFDHHTIESLLDQLVRQTKLAFQGEPLEGLQVMGFLESRLLDFEQLILVGMNEGLIPNGKTTQSFIPWDVRKSFGLFTYRDKDAIFAYHFYRLIQRSSKIDLLYSTSRDETGGGEKSRFLTQIQAELKSAGSTAQISEEMIHLSPESKLHEPMIEIKANAETSILITEWIKRGISPSALSSYINCPLDFFYRHLLRVNPDEEIKEEVEASTMGTFIHDALRILLQPFVGGLYDPGKVSGIKESVKSAFLGTFSEIDLAGGKNHLAVTMAENYIGRLMEIEKTIYLNKEAPFLVALEERLSSFLTIEGHEVQFKGFADRVERRNGKLWIIDYKTGNVEAKDLRFNEISELFIDPAKSKALQLAFYAWLYHKSHPEERTLQAGIISFRKLNEYLMPLSFRKEEKLNEAFFEVFESELTLIIKELLSEGFQLKHRPDSIYCTLCE